MFLLLTAGCVLWLCFVHACVSVHVCLCVWALPDYIKIDWLINKSPYTII